MFRCEERKGEANVDRFVRFPQAISPIWGMVGVYRIATCLFCAGRNLDRARSYNAKPSKEERKKCPYQNNYGIAMNDDGHGGHSQWFKLSIIVQPNGAISINQTVENDVFGQDWFGTYRLEFHDLRDNSLIWAATSAGYHCPSKGINGHAVDVNVGVWNTQMNQAAATQFLANPSLYGVKGDYSNNISLETLGENILNIASTVITGG
jgi:hypothetical protein